MLKLGCVFLHDDLNVIIVKKIPWLRKLSLSLTGRTHSENIPPRNLCIIKANVSHQQKPSFSLKNIYLYSLWYPASLKTLNTHGGVILTLSFPDNIIFLENHFLNCIPFLCPLSKECFILNENKRYPKPLNIYQYHGSPEGDFPLVHLFGVVPGTF